MTAERSVQSGDSSGLNKALVTAFLGNVPDLVYFKDLDSRIIAVSESMVLRTGFNSAEDLIGKRDSDFLSAETAGRTRLEEERIFATGEPILGKPGKQIWRDGRVTWSLTSKMPLRDDSGAVIGMFGLSRDVTKEKEMEMALEKAACLLWQADVTGNPGPELEWKVTLTPSLLYRKIFGEESGHGQDKLWSAEIVPEWDRIRKAAAEALAEDKAEYDQEFQVVVQGRTFYVHEHVSITRVGPSQWNFVGIVVDVTRLKETELQLSKARDVALESSRSKSEFLANMSHEIRTPMNGVIGMTGLILDTELSPTQREFAETIRSSADSLLTIINDILDFSKIEAGKLVFEELDFDLVEAVEDSLELFAERARQKGLELACQIAPDIPRRLRGDQGRLRQIITNLIGNALKFTERGEVVVRAAKESESDTHVVIDFTINDTGIGIAEEAQGRLFQAFTQADSSTTRKFGGTGLGLTISKQLVALMGGTIGVRSSPGQGSTFWFNVRLLKQTEPAEPAPTLYGRELFDLRVLVVDDNATNRQILRHQLFAWKMQKGSAAGGSEALELLRSAANEGKPYDLALLDMQMPEMDGMTLARAIKADAAIARTRLIILTSMGFMHTQDELKAAGIDAYLVKPVKQARLFDCVVKVLGQAVAQYGVAKKVQSAKPAPPSAELEHLRKARILLAEDNIVNQKVALAQLRGLGLTAEAVANGKEVLSALKQVPYDIILMDCQMPEMDGYEASQMIRQAERSNNANWKVPVYIIAMTAAAMTGDRERCLAAGMDDYVSKPVRRADLEIVLAKWAPPVPPRRDP